MLHNYFILILIGHFGAVFSLGADSSPSGAYDVRIPTYDENGRINWELIAEEADNLAEGLYSAKNPRMFILEEQRPATIAQSSSGVFNMTQGKAEGSENLFVTGDGFEAIGKPWTFEENLAHSRNRLAFSEQGKIGFEAEVESGFVNGVGSSKADMSLSGNSFVSERPDDSFSQKFPTTAYGKNIELLDLGNGKRKFTLEYDVFIRMLDSETNATTPQYSTISCDWAELFLGKDENASRGESFGQISKIHAKGNVRLIQPLRKSSAGELSWAEESGRVYLYKKAKVFHQKWGEAQGEKIIIYEKDGRAEVIGGNEGRSRLLLPPLGKSQIQ